MLRTVANSKKILIRVNLSKSIAKKLQNTNLKRLNLCYEPLRILHLLLTLGIKFFNKGRVESL